MKFSAISFISLSGLIGLMGLFSSCSETPQIEGTWQGNPTRIRIPEAEYASSTVTLDFAPNSKSVRSGNVNISAVVDVQQAVNTVVDNSFDQPYTTSLTATVSVDGNYTFEENDDDDIVINFIPDSFIVSVDPSGVTLSENVLTGRPQSTVDSVSAVTAARWKTIITRAMHDELRNYTHIEDIKVHHSDMMSCEISDRDQSFRKVQ